MVAAQLLWRPFSCERACHHLVMTTKDRFAQVLGVVSLLGFSHDFMVSLCVVMSHYVLPRFLRAHGTCPRMDFAWVRFVS
jgi:hypothetical protein